MRLHLHLPLVLLSLFVPSADSAPRKQTVCTITINSPDEKQVFRRVLPESQYNFVELVEHGKPDWLASSCKSAVSCDVLIVSGHFDGDNEFFSDKVEAHEFLTVSELESASCSNNCPSLFAQLKEVYLFGCNTLNSRAQNGNSAETVRQLLHDGRSQANADNALQSLSTVHGHSSMDRMRQLFRDVPVIYGFASTAPLGPISATTLTHHFRTRGASKVASGRMDTSLLSDFSTFSMTSAQGVTAGDPRMQARNDMCRFADNKASTASKLDFVHELLQRPGDDVRYYLDRIQRLSKTLDAPTRSQPAVAQALAKLSADKATRERFLAEERKSASGPARVRWINVARDLGWLDADQRWQELALLLGDIEDRPAIGVPEIDLACQLNQEGELEGAFGHHADARSEDVAHAAVHACLGSSEGRTVVLDALASTREADVQAAQAYLRRRPITDDAELRRLAARIADMPAGDAQVRALEVLAHHYVKDGEVLQTLTRLYTTTPSASVQDAVAGVLVRADRRPLDRVALQRLLTDHRKRVASGGEMVNALLARLNQP